jgi:hypothetical protein
MSGSAAILTSELRILNNLFIVAGVIKMIPLVHQKTEMLIMSLSCTVGIVLHFFIRHLRAPRLIVLTLR